QKRRLARAVGSEQSHDLACGDLERDLGERADLPEGLREGLYFDHAIPTRAAALRTSASSTRVGRWCLRQLTAPCPCAAAGCSTAGFSRRMNPGRKNTKSTGMSVIEATKLTAIHNASSNPISASKRMFENHQTSVPKTMVTAVNVTALPEVL